MKKFLILMITICLMVIFSLPTPAGALQNENIISSEEQTAINNFYANLEAAYNGIVYGNGGYQFMELSTGQFVTYEMIEMFETSFENRNYQNISDYFNENQIAIVKGNFSNVMPFACIGDDCPGEGTITISKTGTFRKSFINQHYLETYGWTINQTANVIFSASYTASSSNEFLYWNQSSGYLGRSLENPYWEDSVRFGYTSIDLNDTTEVGTASFSLYSRSIDNTISTGSFVFEHFICNGSITINGN